MVEELKQKEPRNKTLVEWDGTKALTVTDVEKFFTSVPDADISEKSLHGKQIYKRKNDDELDDVNPSKKPKVENLQQIS
ncbi:DgyrCDS14960 [Dimorphilus gyrociliatus]|uniref:DgyrCDS14960 n=1 Tax=Dimorphilus gyrociliatus TaxID=2664684 RepID=A0A7I8WFK7_9ANNE|nr:DgyrCDS14960 [Dimorphilus gyrociliatus]